MRDMETNSGPRWPSASISAKISASVSPWQTEHEGVRPAATSLHSLHIAPRAEVIALDRDAPDAVAEVEILLAVVERRARGELRRRARPVAQEHAPDVDHVAGDHAVPLDVDLRAVGRDKRVVGRARRQI